MIWAEHIPSGRRRNLSYEEDSAFWARQHDTTRGQRSDDQAAAVIDVRR